MSYSRDKLDQNKIKTAPVDSTKIRIEQANNADLLNVAPDIIRHITNDYLDEKSHAHLNAASSFFYLSDENTLNTRKAIISKELLDYILRANLKAAKQILQKLPRLAFEVSTITFNGITLTISPYQLALRLCDFSLKPNGQKEMVEMIEEIALDRNLLAIQFKEIFPDNYKLLEDARIKLDSKALHDVFNILTTITDETEQKRALVLFQMHVQVSCATPIGKLFNHQLLLDAYELYKKHYILNVNTDRNLPASQVILTIINFMPACYVQAIVNSRFGDFDKLVRINDKWQPYEQDPLSTLMFFSDRITGQLKIRYLNQSALSCVEQILNNKELAIEKRMQTYAPREDLHDPNK